MAISFKPKTVALKGVLDSANQKAKEEEIAHNSLVDPVLDQVDQMVLDQEKPPILQKIMEIESLLSKEQVPVATLKSACRTVMLSLKENSDTILELEPEDISQIVQAYMHVANEEAKAVLTKKKKAPKKKRTLSLKAKELQDMSKEVDQSKMDFSFIKDI